MRLQGRRDRTGANAAPNGRIALLLLWNHISLKLPSNPIVRLGKYVSIILVLGGICGGICALYDYYMQFRADAHWERRESAERVERDTPAATKRRFVVGAAIGAFFGIVYVGRCIRRREEP